MSSIDQKSPALSSTAREYLLAFADDEHMIGARHTSWIGLGPFLEEDLAFCSIAQDELGHAIALYDIVLVADGIDPDSALDAFALLRSPNDYRSSWLAELDCSDWSDSLVRHWLYDRAESLRWGALAGSAHPRLVGLSARAMREEAFHLEHAEQFMARIVSGEAASAPGPIVDALARILPIACASWVSTEGEAAAIAEGIATTTSGEMSVDWRAQIDADAQRWGLDLTWPDDGEIRRLIDAQANRRVRSDGFAEFHTGLGNVLALDESATW